MNSDAPPPGKPAEAEVVKVRVQSGVDAAEQTGGEGEELPRKGNPDSRSPKKPSKDAMRQPFVHRHHLRQQCAVVLPLHDPERDYFLTGAYIRNRLFKDDTARFFLDREVGVADAEEVGVDQLDQASDLRQLRTAWHFDDFEIMRSFRPGFG